MTATTSTSLTMHARLPGYATPLYADHTPSRDEIRAWLAKLTGDADAWLRDARERLTGGSHAGIYCSKAVLGVVAAMLHLPYDRAAREVLFLSER